jgi:ribosomal protein L7/L12
MVKKPAAKVVAPVFFADAAAFREWLQQHHAEATELLVGFHKKASGVASITWPESVDEALCLGWIDGIRKAIDGHRYQIRFTPRKADSTWSAVNIARVAALTAEGRMQASGLAAFARRRPDRSATYAYEQTQVASLFPGAAAGLPEKTAVVGSRRQTGRNAGAAAGPTYRCLYERRADVSLRAMHDLGTDACGRQAAHALVEQIFPRHDDGDGRICAAVAGTMASRLPMGLSIFVRAPTRRDAMNDSKGGLPAEVLAALRQGQTIMAIKRLRDARGIDLKQAKELVERHLAGQPPSQRTFAVGDDLPAEALDALREGKLIEAIKHLRTASGLGLKEAKDVVDDWPRPSPSRRPSVATAMAIGAGCSAWAWRQWPRGFSCPAGLEPNRDDRCGQPCVMPGKDGQPMDAGAAQIPIGSMTLPAAVSCPYPH